MTLEQALVTFLLADPAISSLVVDRIGPWSGQGDAVPRITYELVSQDDEYALDGCIDEPTATLNIECRAATQMDCRILAGLVKNSRGGGSGKRLKEFQGIMGSLFVSASLLNDMGDFTEASQDSSGRPVPGVKLVWAACYVEQ
jgi:hypothetical protein